MAPSSEEDVRSESHKKDGKKQLTGEEIVITGISGLFPNSNSVTEFMDNLYNKVDMVKKDDLNFDHPEAPKYVGKISDIRKFDSQFFRVTSNQAASMEPLSRKIMEEAYSAIYDSGINPLVFKGKKVGVYIGNSYLDSSNMSMYSGRNQNGFIISGCSKCMISNRISYFLDAKAPSLSLDCSCAGGLVCLEQAYNDIKSGICENALVGACELCLHPVVSLNIKRTGLLSLDGKTKCFDKNGEGYVRSETVSLLFLQKAKDANRIYAEISAIKTTFGLKADTDFLSARKQDDIVDFIENFYADAGIPSSEVEYIEAHGAALPEADTNELEAISRVFAKEKSIKVGCVKSNMGNSSSASGLCGIAKLCLSYHTGMLPANINYNEPLDIPAIKESRVKVLTNHTPFNRGFTAVNNFSLTGTNCHVLLKGHYKSKDRKRYDCKLPRLIFISGRTKINIEKILDILKSQPIDSELIGLLHNIYNVDTPGHTCRGFGIFDTNENKETVVLSQSVEHYQGVKRPLWLVYSGMGSQWSGMGAELMRIPTFAAAIEKCRKVLEPKGVDIIRIITDPDPSIFDYVVNCFVGIAAVQIGLTDILKEMGIVPDNYLGHSVGEMGCAYFDGCFTAEEMILAAYIRGKVSVETDFIKGSMAAIGLGYNDVLPLVPPEIDIACHNSSESCTISGPSDCVKSFVVEMTAKNIFAKEVASANIPYHSKYVAKAGPRFIKQLSEILKKRVARSEKWICTSMPKERWDEPLAKIFSPDYLANNLLSPVYFEESAKLIPPNAVVIEVAPHGLLQAILKRSHRECLHVPLTRRGHSDPVQYLFENFGKLYTEGYNIRPDIFYPKIEFPVSTETPMISNFVDWYHEVNWATTTYVPRMSVVTSKRKFAMSVQDDDYKFISGHVIEDNIIFPKAAVLFLVWETLAMYKGLYFKSMSVAFRDVHFHGEVIINQEDTMKLDITLNKGNDYFEVTRSKILITSGYVSEVLKPTSVPVDQDVFRNSVIDILHLDDIYTMFDTKGYRYRGEFQSMLSVSGKWNAARIKWTGNWITFIDSLLQLNTLARNHDSISTLKVIKNMTINVVDHSNWINATDSSDVYFDVNRDEYSDLTRCSGVEIRDIIFKDQSLQGQQPDVLQAMSFIPYELLTNAVDLKEALQINLQIVADNTDTDVITISAYTNDLVPDINSVIHSVEENILDVSFQVEPVGSEYFKSFEKCHLLIGGNLIKKSVLNDFYDEIGTQTFVLSFEDKKETLILEKYKNFNVISTIVLDKNILVLLRKSAIVENISFIPVTHDTLFSWVAHVQNELKQKRKVILITKRLPLRGIFGLVKNLRRNFHNCLSIFIIDDHKTSWDPEKNIFKEQIEKNLTFNVLKKGHWGSYYFVPCKKSTRIQKSFTLTNATNGHIDGLKWTELTLGQETKNNIKVCYAGPSIRDVQTAVGIFDTKTKRFGMDFSGVDKKGNRVMGLISSGALSSSVQANPDMLWPVPDTWTLEEAATIPLPYVQAMYCLTIRGQLHSNQSVFVTGGAGALGQAVISICLAVGCTVYTCVGDIYKKRFLMKLFPSLNEKHIAYSNDSSFFTNIASNSKNMCCDFVINCLSGPTREFAMKCVGMYGFFLDLSTNDMTNDKVLGMFYLEKDRTYKAVDLSNIFKPEHASDKKVLQRAISEGIAKGYVKPISHVIFSCEEVSRAFRFLALSKHRGRVLININDLEAPLKMMSFIPKLTLAANSTYVVVCDETILGIKIAKRLIIRGANKITLHMKVNLGTGYLQAELIRLRKLGANVMISTEKIQTESGCLKFLIDAQAFGQIDGIFFVQGCCSKTSGFSQDSLVEKRNNVISVVDNLNNVSRNNCRDLRYFVVISRVSKSFLDEYNTSVLQNICEQRAESGLPSLMFRAALQDLEHLEFADNKVQFQPIETALNALEKSLIYQFSDVLTYNLKKNSSRRLMKKITNILGFNIKNIDINLTLRDIIPSELCIEEIKLAIKELSSFEYTSEDIKDFTVERLISLEEVTAKNINMVTSGLSAFFNFVEKDEYTANECLIPMSTLGTSLETEDELNTYGTYLMLIPGFNGHYQMYKTICERLKIEAVTLQIAPNENESSIPEIAFNIKMHIVKRFAFKSKFYLLGYSFGVNVALEVAALLEKDGLTGIVYCLDSSPEALRVQLDAFLGYQSETQLQNVILEHFYYVMSGQKSEQLKQDIAKIENWSDKIEVCITHLKKLVTYTTQYQRAVLDTAYKRIIMARKYKPCFKLESELVLLKGIPHPNAESLPFDYNLSNYTKKPVRVYELSSNMASIPEDSRVSNIINQLLDPELLKDFKQKNLCETYLTFPCIIK